MPPNPGIYLLEYVIFPGQKDPGGEDPKPEPPRYLTNNGEGKQLTIETATDKINQEWNIIRPPLTGEQYYLTDRILLPALPATEEAQAVSQDVVKFPVQISLIKNLQVWSFDEDQHTRLYAIRSHLYDSDPEVVKDKVPLLGTDKEHHHEAVIRFLPIIYVPGEHRPLWKLIPVLKK